MIIQTFACLPLSILGVTNYACALPTCLFFFQTCNRVLEDVLTTTWGRACIVPLSTKQGFQWHWHGALSETWKAERNEDFFRLPSFCSDNKYTSLTFCLFSARLRSKKWIPTTFAGWTSKFILALIGKNHDRISVQTLSAVHFLWTCVGLEGANSTTVYWFLRETLLRYSLSCRCKHQQCPYFLPSQAALSIIFLALKNACAVPHLIIWKWIT